MSCWWATKVRLSRITYYFCIGKSNLHPAGRPASIITIPVQSQALVYTPYQESNLSSPTPISKVQAGCKTAALPEDASFTPIRMDVQDATDARGEVPARICLLGSNRSTYKVFALGGEPSKTARPAEAAQSG